MRAIFYVAVSALAAVAAAVGPNPFSIPSQGYSFSAGSPVTLNWDPTTQGPVTLVLKWGAVSQPNSGITLASGIPNSGSFVWTPSASLPDRSDYTIEIVVDQNPSEYNFLPQFSIAGATGAVSSAMPSSTPASSSIASSTGAASSSMMTTSASSSSATASASSMSSAASKSATTSSSMSMTTSASAGSSSSATAAPTSVPNTNAGVARGHSGVLIALAMAVFALL